MKFSEHHEYLIIPTNGKRKAFVKGWIAKELNNNVTSCPYEPRIKDFLPTNPYFQYWHLGYECCLIQNDNTFIPSAEQIPPDPTPE